MLATCLHRKKHSSKFAIRRPNSEADNEKNERILKHSFDFPQKYGCINILESELQTEIA